jgi:lysophospholipase L1-like esterase
MKSHFVKIGFVKRVQAVIALLVLSAVCTASAADAVLPPPNNVAQTIAYHGDSTIFGRRVPKPCWVVFDENIPANYTTRDESVPGASISQLLRGRDGRHPEWKTWVAQSTDKVIITNHAINDAEEFPVEVFKENYRQIIDIAHAAGKFIILETPNPTKQGDRLKVFADAMKQVAAEKNVPVIDQFKYLSEYMVANNVKIEELVPDGFHPTAFFHDLKGKYAAKRFKEIVGLPAIE